MSEIIVKRNYTLSDGELAMFLSNFCIVLERDLTDLTAFGLTQAKIDDLRDLGDDFEDLPSDEYSAGLQAIETEKKNNILKNLLEQTAQMAWRVESKWGADSREYNMLGIAGIYNQPEDTVTRLARNVHKTMQHFLADLADFGLTQAMLDAYLALANSFEAAKNDQFSVTINRDADAKARINMGNEIYKEITRWCELGKKLYAKTAPEKYNDYIIYTTSSPGSLIAPQNFMFDPVNYDFSWSAVDNATSYILQQSTDGVNWTQFWSGHETTCGYEESPTTMMYFRVLGHNAGGNSAPSTVIQYDFAPILVAPTNFNYDYNTYYFSWNAVPNAEYYEFQYRAQTNPTWNSLNAGSATSFYHADPPGDYLARVRGAVGTNLGPWSVEEEYSVGAP